MSQIYQLHISLNHIQPEIWRRVLVPSDISLDDLHGIIQVVMGWENCHLHEFMAQRTRYGAPDPMFGGEVLDESKYVISDLLKTGSTKCLYIYDFGDDWAHTITLEKILPADSDQPLPFCVAGENACPPEDVGGLPGYEMFLEAISDKNHPNHEHLMEYAGEGFDPEGFDVDTVNTLLKH